MDPDGEYLVRIWDEHVYPLAEKMGFAMKRPQVQPRTRMAHAVAKWAADNGKFDSFNRAVFKAFFQDGCDIGNHDVLIQIAQKIGLNANELESQGRMDLYMQQVLNDAEKAKRAHVRAVPAFVANGRVFASGVQSFSQLQQLIPLL